MYVTIQQLSILKISYRLIGVFMTPEKGIPLVLMLSLEELGFLVLGKSNLGILLVAQYGPTILP